MRVIYRCVFFVSIFFALFPAVAVHADNGPLKFTSSTQFMWGDDVLGNSQAIIAQYLRFSYRPEGKHGFSIAGYGRIWDDLDSGSIRDTDFNGRLYYLYLDYSPIDEVSMRLGRQYVNLAAGSSMMDGATLNFHPPGLLGLTVTAGRDVIFTLDSESSREGNYFVGFDVQLQKVKNVQLGVSYVMKYDDSDLSREEFGLNARYIYKWIIPYAQLRYDWLSKAIDEATIGVNLLPVKDLALKAEFFHSYPTFDSTSIFSVFAVNKFREYLFSAEYSLPKSPFTFFGQYRRQTYDDESNADVFAMGTKVFPNDKLSFGASVDYSHSYDDRNWGFEVTGDYRASQKFLLAAGVQYNAYQRPDDAGNRSAQRYWVGGKWHATKNMDVAVRVEDNANETFNHRTLGRLTLNWKL